MNFKIEYTSKFREQLNNSIKQGKDINKLQEVIDFLSVGNKLPAKYNQHKLPGKFNNFWACYIETYWLLIWKEDKNILTLSMNFIGSNSDLYGFENPDELLH